jgi:hypothetical protein
MNGPSSPFYPPRARWYSRWLGRLECLFPSLQPGLVPVASRLGWKAWLVGLLVPGAGFWLTGRPLPGRWCFAANVVLLLVGLAAVGHPPSVAALVCAALIHVAGIVRLVHRMTPGHAVVYRIGSVLLPPVFYLKACVLVGEFLFFPVEIDGHVVVVSRLTEPAEVRVGDLVACRAVDPGTRGVQAREGIELGHVLAMGGTRVEFGPMHLRTSEGILPTRYGMPARGSLVLGEKVWFIWPTEINTRRNPEAESLLLQAAQVPHEALVGRMFRHWFGRVQSVP